MHLSSKISWPHILEWGLEIKQDGQHMWQCNQKLHCDTCPEIKALPSISSVIFSKHFNVIILTTLFLHGKERGLFTELNSLNWLFRTLFFFLTLALENNFWVYHSLVVTSQKVGMEKISNTIRLLMSEAIKSFIERKKENPELFKDFMPISTVKYSILFFLPHRLWGFTWPPRRCHTSQPHPKLSWCHLRSCTEMVAQVMIRGSVYI